MVTGPVPAGVEALTEERARPVAATTTFLVGPGGGGSVAGTGDVVFALVGGACYALDAATGKALWRRVVGADSTELPTPIAGDGKLRVLLNDRRSHELVLVEGRTGKLVWRQTIGEPADAAPLVHQGRVYWPTRLGRLFVLDQATGRVLGHLSFPQPLPVTPVADAAGETLYLVG